MSGPVETAQAFWGNELPDWVLLLAQECARSSQADVARKIRRSPSLVSAVLRRRYEGDLEAVEDVVRGALERATIDCPARGEIGRHTCRDWMAMAKVYIPVNSERIRMHDACTRCPRFRKESA